MTDTVIETRALTKRYGRVLAVDRLSLQVPRGHACSACSAPTARARRP